jgi:hypothetical protein
MKIDPKVVVVIIIAVLILIGYLTYPFVVEGLPSSSVETKTSTIQKQLSQAKYKDPKDHVIIGQKIDLLQQGITILTAVLADPKFMAEDKKKNYQRILADWQTQLAPLPQKRIDAKAALDASRKKPPR